MVIALAWAFIMACCLAFSISREAIRRGKEIAAKERRIAFLEQVVDDCDVRIKAQHEVTESYDKAWKNEIKKRLEVEGNVLEHINPHREQAERLLARLSIVRRVVAGEADGCASAIEELMNTQSVPTV